MHRPRLPRGGRLGEARDVVARAASGAGMTVPGAGWSAGAHRGVLCNIRSPGSFALRSNCGGRIVCRRNATITASSSRVRTVDVASFGPVGRSVAEVRFFHFATAFWLIPCRLARALRLSSPCRIAPFPAIAAQSPARQPTDCLSPRPSPGQAVVALPCRTWPIAHPSIPRKRWSHQSPG